MATAVPSSTIRKSPIRVGHVVLFVFGLMLLFVVLTRDRTLLDPNSFLRQRYAAIPWLMLAHGIPGMLALLLGMFQFSERLRRRYLQVHRVMGRIYVGCVVISAPTAVVVAMRLPIPTLLAAATIQALGWIAATAVGLYCARTGRIQQHREWMMRGYPFAMVFAVVRVITAIPAVSRTGVIGAETTVWAVIALAGIVPSFVIALQSLGKGKRPATLRARA